MQKLISTTFFMLATTLIAPSSRGLPSAGSVARAETGKTGETGNTGNTGSSPQAAALAEKPDLEKLGQHLREHQKYPATRAELLASCKGLVDFSPAEKRWFAEHLHAGTYGSADEVLKAIARK
jgi:hypothetical protein